MHLTQEEIELYVSRHASVDELLAIAQHLDDCYECRDRAAAVVDSGKGEISHTRRGKMISAPPPAAPRKRIGRWVLPWLFAAAAIGLAIWLLVSAMR
ncbi:MAG: hypothetical protein JOZ54_05230 [Acidobacteria bacterium]|nr:hypothetical protein [Acidobacteriota bacterium]